MKNNAVKNKSLIYVFLGFSILISISLVVIMGTSTLQKRLPFLLVFLLPLATIKLLPSIIVAFTLWKKKRCISFIAAALAGAGLILLVQFTLLPFVQHRLHLNFEITNPRHNQFLRADRLMLVGIGDEKGIMQSSEDWNDFEWYWRNGANMGRFDRIADTDVLVSWKNPHLYFRADSNPKFQFCISINNKKYFYTLSDLVPEGDFYRIPLQVDLWAQIAVTIYFYIFSFIILLFLIVKISGSSQQIALTGTSFFILFLFTPLTLLLLNTLRFDPVAFEDSENRAPHEFSVKTYLQNFHVWDLDEIPGDFEQWYNDRFGLRDQFIQFYGALDYLFLNESFISNRVITGKNGFLFVNDFFQNVISKQRGAYGIPIQRQKNWVLTQQERYQYLKDRDIEFFFFITPNKHSIYPEYLPDWATRQVNYSFTDMLIRRRGFLKKDFPLIDARQAILDAKEQWGDFLYGKTDTHWTFLGAFTGYQLLIENINETTDWGIPLLKTEEINIEYFPSGYHLTKMLKLQNIIDFNDHLIHYSYEEAETGKIYKVSANGKKIEIDPYHRIPWDSTYRIFNDRPLIDKKLLIFRDSFSSQLSPMLNETFSEVVYIHYNHGLKDFTSLVEEFQPDLVIIETGERGLNSQSLYDKF